jgi:hypothetical protein
LFGLYLQFDDPDDFILFLAERDVKFANAKHRDEFLRAFAAKKEIIQEL